VVNLYILAFVFAIVSWIAHWFEIRWLYLITKPLVILTLVAWSLLGSGWRGEILWFGLALIFSLLGDIALMVSPDRFFLQGLVFFLIAHLFYLVGFNLTFPTWQPLMLLILLVCLLVLAWYIRLILKNLRSDAKNRPMQVPVLVYCAVLGLMFLSGLSKLFDPLWPLRAGVLVALGAGLFVISDCILAYNRFVKPLRHVSISVLIPYHLAQAFIILGVLIRYPPG
jgi:uncharacterized membrane protein YhhN